MEQDFVEKKQKPWQKIILEFKLLYRVSDIYENDKKKSGFCPSPENGEVNTTLTGASSTHSVYY